MYKIGFAKIIIADVMLQIKRTSSATYQQRSRETDFYWSFISFTNANASFT